MRKHLLTLILSLALMAACTPAPTPTLPAPTLAPTREVTPAPEASLTPTVSPTPTISPSPTANLTPEYPAEGLGPTGFPEGVNPFTGWPVADPALLDRRPLVIKVENLPREHRPQYGLNKADLVYEYYTELGSTRFAAVYYGQNAEKVGPVRSARHFDVNVVQMVKGILVFGSAYEGVMNRLFKSDFGDRLVVEGQFSCPALCRTSAAEGGLLMANTAAMNKFLKEARINNQRQVQDGMFFRAQIPQGGEAVQSVFVRFSGAIYNRWDYDPASGRWLRFSDTANALDGTKESYAALMDKAEGKQVAADNVVILFAPYTPLVRTATTEVWDVPLYGSGQAFIARDGQIFPVLWLRNSPASPLILTDATGKLQFPFKPGNTWFEVVNTGSPVTRADGSLRVTNLMP